MTALGNMERVAVLSAVELRPAVTDRCANPFCSHAKTKGLPLHLEFLRFHDPSLRMCDKLTAANDTLCDGWREKLELGVRTYFSGIRLTISLTYTIRAGLWLQSFFNVLFSLIRNAPPFRRQAAKDISRFQTTQEGARRTMKTDRRDNRTESFPKRPPHRYRHL
jgi:hypothetical protein